MTTPRTGDGIKDRPNIGCIGSNFDMELDRQIEARLLSEPSCATYAAWEWNGIVWYNHGWHMEIWRYCAHITTIHADSLDALQDKAVSTFGGD